MGGRFALRFPLVPTLPVPRVPLGPISPKLRAVIGPLERALEGGPKCALAGGRLIDLPPFMVPFDPNDREANGLFPGGRPMKPPVRRSELGSPPIRDAPPGAPP